MKKDIQGGLLLCKTFSPSPFWVLFGKVDEPRFLLDEKKFVYRNRRGYGFLLIPTMTVGKGNKFGKLNSSDFIDYCWRMGLREHPNYFFPLIYSLSLAKFDETTIKELIEDFKDLYSKDELLIRLGHTFKQTESIHTYHWGYNESKNLFVGYEKDNSNLQSKIQVLNILLSALDIKNKTDLNKNLSEGMKLNNVFLNQR